jgi:plastocyanin
MLVKRTILVVVTVGALLMGACGGDDDGGEANGTGDGGGGGGGLQITASGTAYDPESLTAPAGDIEVSLTNEDGIAHTFTIDDLDVDLEVDGDSSDSVSFSAEAGTFEYNCRFHSQMTGDLTVE